MGNVVDERLTEQPLRLPSITYAQQLAEEPHVESRPDSDDEAKDVTEVETTEPSDIFSFEASTMETDQTRHASASICETRSDTTTKPLSETRLAEDRRRRVFRDELTNDATSSVRSVPRSGVL